MEWKITNLVRYAIEFVVEEPQKAQIMPIIMAIYRG